MKMGNIISSKKKRHKLKFTKARKTSRSGNMIGNANNGGGDSSTHANADTDDARPTMNDDDGQHSAEDETIINAHVQITPPPPPPTEYTDIDDSYVCGVPVAQPIVVSSKKTNAGVNNNTAAAANNNNDSSGDDAPSLNNCIDQNYCRLPNIPPEMAAEQLAKANIAMAIQVDDDETQFDHVGKRMARMGLLG